MLINRCAVNYRPQPQVQNLFGLCLNNAGPWVTNKSVENSARRTRVSRAHYFARRFGVAGGVESLRAGGDEGAGQDGGDAQLPRGGGNPRARETPERKWRRMLQGASSDAGHGRENSGANRYFSPREPAMFFWLHLASRTIAPDSSS